MMENPVNTGIPYEVLVQQIFQTIANDTKADRTIVIQHDVTLQGITLRHQIDVYWEFEHLGILHKVVVQVKNWNNPLSQGELLKFKGVLDDLPGQPRGVVVTRRGYQSGAAEFASAHDIRLFELNEWEPTSRVPTTLTALGCAHAEVLGKVPKGEPPRLLLRVTPFEPQIDQPIFEADPAWLKDLSPDVAAVLIGKRINYATPADISFYDESGNVVGNLHAICKETVEDMKKEGATQVRKLLHRFSAPTFIDTGLPAVPRMKITGFSANISIKRGEPVDSPFDVPNIVTFILRDLSTGKKRLVQRQK
jgi:restriction endonuclease